MSPDTESGPPGRSTIRRRFLQQVGLATAALLPLAARATPTPLAGQTPDACSGEIHVIALPCIGTKDTACVDACPLDAIHPKRDESQHFGASQLYIDPNTCLGCGACVPVCPVNAIFALSELPERWQAFAAFNANYYNGTGGPLAP